MEKREYISPEVKEVAVDNQDMLCLSGESNVDINDEFTEADQLTNKNVWEDLW